ncbi:MAG: hypothetical protein H8E91_03875 [Planctomycetes bacterium]|nr:hypothetical protein [Planctomycetota bacterium]
MEDITTTKEIKWSVRPAKMHPKKAVFALLVDLGFGALIASNSLILGICMTAVLIGTQATFLFTSKFTISEAGVKAKYPARTKYYTWEQIRRAKFFKEACYLFTRKKPSNLDGWSGIAVFYGEDRDKIVAAIKSRLSSEVAS